MREGKINWYTEVNALKRALWGVRNNDRSMKNKKLNNTKAS